jgi:hypothetical protein
MGAGRVVDRRADTAGWSLLPGAPALTRSGLAPARTTRLSRRTMHCFVSRGPPSPPAGLAGDCALHLDSDQMSAVPGSENLFSPPWSPDGKYLTAMTGDSQQLMLFDFQTQKWREWVSGSPNIALPKWSRDSRYVDYDEYSLKGSRSWRIRIGTKRPELAVDSTGFQRFIRPFVGPWTGLPRMDLPSLCAI